MSEVYSATYDSWHCCLAVHESVILDKCEGFLVCPHREPPPLQVVAEMPDAGKDSIQLPVKGAVRQLHWFQLGGEEAQWPSVSGRRLSLL